MIQQGEQLRELPSSLRIVESVAASGAAALAAAARPRTRGTAESMKPSVGAVGCGDAAAISAPAVGAAAAPPAASMPTRVSLAGTLPSSDRTA